MGTETNTVRVDQLTEGTIFVPKGRKQPLEFFGDMYSNNPGWVLMCCMNTQNGGMVALCLPDDEMVTVC